jgi:hypothetical protein
VDTRCFGVRDHHLLRLRGILPSYPGRPSILDLCASRSYDAAIVAASLERTVSRARTSERRSLRLLLSRIKLAKPVSLSGKHSASVLRATRLSGSGQSTTTHADTDDLSGVLQQSWVGLHCHHAFMHMPTCSGRCT